jgi:peptide/nickel transport system substrate-binding protein
MQKLLPRVVCLLTPLALALVGGCSSDRAETEVAQDEASTSSAADAPAASSASDAVQEFVLGNALDKFEPPTLEELDKVAWKDGRMIDSLEALREEQAALGPPKVSVEEALALKNDSDENNAKILDALGRVAPADGAGVDYDAKIVRHAGGDLNSTNPLFMSSVTDSEFGDLTGIAIIGFDRELTYYAPTDIVASWQSSEDGLMDRFVLRDDITWSDGKPFTAHDVEFTFQLIMSDHPQLVIPAIRTGTDQLRWVKAYDDHTLVVFHKEPLATNLPNMIYPILPKHIYEKSVYEDPSLKRSAYHTQQEARPVTGGPYEYVSRKRGEEFVVRRRESYYMHDGKQVRPKPYFAEVRVKTIEDLNTALLAFKAGDVHQMELRPEQWEVQTNNDEFYSRNTKVRAPEWTEFHIEWNSGSQYFADERVRWAMTYAVDYDELLATLLRNLCTQGQGTFHPQSWMFPKNPPEPVKRDLDKAEDLLDEAGWEDSDGDGIRDKEIDGQIVPFEIQLMTYQSELGNLVGVLLKENLEEIGISVNVKPTEFVVMQDKLLKHEFDACFGGWGAGADPDAQSNIYGTGGQRNYGQYSNPKVDELFEKGRRELDRAKRAEIYGQIHMQLWEDQPVTWLFYRPALFGFNKKLRGYNFGALGPFKYSPGFGSLYMPAAAP